MRGGPGQPQADADGGTPAEYATPEKFAMRHPKGPSSRSSPRSAIELKNLVPYFRRVHDLLKPGGWALNHGITASDAFNRETSYGGGRFIDQYVFPDGELPHIGTVLTDMQMGGLPLSTTRFRSTRCCATARANRPRACPGRASGCTAEGRSGVRHARIVECSMGCLPPKFRRQAAHTAVFG